MGKNLAMPEEEPKKLSFSELKKKVEDGNATKQERQEYFRKDRKAGKKEKNNKKKGEK